MVVTHPAHHLEPGELPVPVPQGSTLRQVVVQGTLRHSALPEHLHSFVVALRPVPAKPAVLPRRSIVVEPQFHDELSVGCVFSEEVLNRPTMLKIVTRPTTKSG